jgi:lipid-A-disaccharide synthase
MKRESSRVLIVGGEASGDLYGGLLMRAMAATPGGASTPTGAAAGRPVGFVGIGGPAMRAAGLEMLGDAGSMGVTGLFEVLVRLRVIWRAYRAARDLLADPGRRPDLAILIDYPDFNLRLARHARRAGVPVLYFISPQVWAWRKGRVRQIAAVVDRMLVILPFEEEIYRRAAVPVEFVGHPLLDLVRVERGREQALGPLGLDPRRPTVALLPGSRQNEVAALLPAMLGAARLLKEEFTDLQFLIPLAPTVQRAEMEEAVRRAKERAGVELRGGYASGRPARRDPDPAPVLVEEGRYDAVAAADVAVVASGTATLETALLGVPMVIVYRMSPITFTLARWISDVPHIGMANLIAGERLVPELVQGECRADTIAAQVRRILTEPETAARMRRGLAEVRSRLGRPGAIARAAGAAWGMIGTAPPAAAGRREALPTGSGGRGA